MTIECYVSACPFHSFHDGVDEGPFCFHEECQVSPSYIKTVERFRPDSLSNDEIAKLEKEYMGDPDKKTGIYHPDNFKRNKPGIVMPDDPAFDPERPKFNPHDMVVGTLKLKHYSVRYEWKINDDGKTLASTVYFDALGHQDAMRQFFGIYNGSKPLVSLTIKQSRP